MENTTSELQVKSSVSQHKPLLSVQNSKDLRPASPLHSSYRLTPETMQYMVSSKDLETMREILGEKVGDSFCTRAFAKQIINQSNALSFPLPLFGCYKRGVINMAWHKCLFSCASFSEEFSH